MTRKDYEAIARVFAMMLNTHGATESESGVVARAAVRRVAQRLADTFDSTQPNFHRDRFLAACEPHDSGICSSCGAFDPTGDEAAWHADACEVVTH